MEREIKRGDVYWVSSGDSVGWEMPSGRPAVVVSADGFNSKISTVVVAYVTSNETISSPAKVKISMENQQKAVVCHQLRTVDKSRLDRYITTLSKDEMSRISGALAITFCIPNNNISVSAPPVENNSNVVALQVEVDILRKQYDKLLERVVEKQVSEDIAKRTKTPAPAPAPIVESPVIESDPTKVEINSCTLEELRKIGCSQTVATSIMAHRPYKSVDDLKIVPWVTSTGFQILKNKVCCVPVIPPKFKMKPAPNVVNRETTNAPSKLNVNTCTVDEIVGLGINRTTALQIIAVRKKNGPYEKIEDLLNVPRIGRVALPKYAAKLEV